MFGISTHLHVFERIERAYSPESHIIYKEFIFKALKTENDSERGNPDAYFEQYE